MMYQYSTGIDANDSRRWLAVALVTASAGGLTMGFGRLTFAFVLEDMRRDFVGSYTAAGVIGAANLLGYLVGVACANLWLRSTGPVTLLRWGAGLTVVGLVTVPAIPSVPAALAGTCLLGFAGGLVWIACVPIVSSTAPERRRGVAYGVMLSGIGTSIAVTGWIVRVCHRAFGGGAWREVWLTEAGIGLAILVLLMLALPAVPPPVRDLPVGRPVVATGVAAAAACYLFYGVAHSLYTNFLVAGAQDGGHLSVSGATSVYAVLGLTNIVGGVLLGRASDAVGRRTVLVAAMVLICSCAAVIPLHLTVATAASGAMYGLLMSGFPAVLIATLSDRFAGRALASAYTAVTLAVGAGQMIGPPLGGVLADRSGSFTATFLVAAATAAAGAVAATLIRDHPRRPTQSR